MCRNIRPLHNFEPPASKAEVHDAALQYVRKIAGTSKPSKANEEAFNRAVSEIAHATQHLLDELVSRRRPRTARWRRPRRGRDRPIASLPRSTGCRAFRRSELPINRVAG